VGAIIASDESDIAPMRAARESPVLNLAAILFSIEGMQEAVDGSSPTGLEGDNYLRKRTKPNRSDGSANMCYFSVTKVRSCLET
jgi:hypothetical protein